MSLLAVTGNFPPWTVAPFVGLLLTIALLPLVAPKWWHRNRNKALVGALFGFPAGAFVASQNLAALGHTALEYAAFLSLIGALYVIAGGIEVRGSLTGTPTTNAAMLAFGAAIANVIGTTGASMLLIRPLLRANHHRHSRVHLVVFFIFIVANVGGSLTPLGDPPLFLGFLHGVPFQWTLLHLWRPWLLAMGCLLVIFVFVDQSILSREAKREGHEIPTDGRRQPLSIRGGMNLLLLAGVVAVAVIGGRYVYPRWGGSGSQIFQCLSLCGLAGISLALTRSEIRKANEFSWHPLIEVAVLFAGIFVSMIPALGVLQTRGQELGVSEPWQFFWATGSLSAILDNAPTYLAFVSLAQFLPDEVTGTTHAALAAISCGAVFFGAMTYIGNGPNFMVKAIAEHSGVKMPSFFRYIAWSCLFLLPIFVLITLVFFR